MASKKQARPNPETAYLMALIVAQEAVVDNLQAAQVAAGERLYRAGEHLKMLKSSLRTVTRDPRWMRSYGADVPWELPHEAESRKRHERRAKNKKK